MLASFLTICIGHLFVDYMTTYGIRFLLPFSSTTFSADNIFVIDLIYTIPLIVLWLIYTFLKKVRARRIVKIISWVWLILYPLFTLFAKHIVTEKFTDSLDAKNISYSRVYTTPEPLQAFLWRGVVQ